MPPPLDMESNDLGKIKNWLTQKKRPYRWKFRPLWRRWSQWAAASFRSVVTM